MGATPQFRAVAPMPSPQSQLIHEWQQLLQRFPSELRARVAEVASAHRGELAEHFYREMTSDEQARPFLAHQKVKERLEPAMQRWISSVLSVQEEGLAAQVASQRQIGEIHARVRSEERRVGKAGRRG